MVGTAKFVISILHSIQFRVREYELQTLASRIW
jgi:hypothetical protein